MSSAEIRAGKAFIEIGIRDKTAAALARAQARLQAFGNATRAIGTALAGFGAAGLGAFIGAAKSFADFGSELHDMAGRTGLAADNLSELKYAAEQTGASMAEVEIALRNMARQGISPELFDQYATSIAAIEDPALRVAAAMKLWGKSGTAVLPMAKELAALRAEAKSLGFDISPEQAAAADELGDAWGRLKTAMAGTVRQIGAAVAPMFTAILNALTPLVVGITGFVQANPALVQGMAIAAGVAAALGTAFLAVASVALTISAAIAAIPMIVTAATATFTALGAVMSFLATPFGMVVVALTAIIGALIAVNLYWNTIMRSMIRATANMVSAVGGLLKEMERDFGVDMGSGSFDKWAKQIREYEKLFPDDKKHPGSPGSKPPVNIPDFGLGEMKSVIGSSRGTFFGGRAESLSIGSGGGVEKKLDEVKGILNQIKDGIDDQIDATEDIESPSFT